MTAKLRSVLCLLMTLQLCGCAKFDLRKNIADIKIPTLVLSGSKDNNAPAKTMAKMATLVPGATYVELEGVGHLASFERPREFNEVLADFLKTSHNLSGSSS